MWMVVGRLIEESEHSGQLRRDQTGTAHPVWPAGRPGEARRRRAPRGAITRGRRRSLRGPLQASQLGCVRPRAQDASKPADAEDLPQEIFLQAYDKIDKFEGRSAFGTWLYRLGVNRCLDHLRSRSAKERSRTEPLGPTLPAEPESALEIWSSSGLSASFLLRAAPHSCSTTSKAMSTKKWARFSE